MNCAETFQVDTLAAKPLHKAAHWLRRRWTAYWQRRAYLATMAILQRLDDRTLKDLGLHRSEIGSLVYGTRADRRQA